MKNISGNPYLKKEDGRILFDLVFLEDILNKYKTPLLIFLENRIRDNIKSFIDVVRSEFKNFECFYSFKANFLPEICKIIHSEYIGANVAGLPELGLALKVGFHPDSILAGGLYLPKELIRVGIKNQIKELVVYNLNDIKKINLLAQKFNSIQNICIRVNSKKYDSKLGINFNKKNLMMLKNLIKSCKNIKITTILSHYSTQMNNIEQFKKNILTILEWLENFSREGIDIKNINIGGGFPEAVIMPQNQLKKVIENIRITLEDFGINYEKIYFEPGRYLVGDSGLFITKIIKANSDRWVFLNIGNQICPKFARCSLRFYNASHIEEPHKYKTSFAGIIPTDQDVLAKDYFFTDNLIEGDKILVTNTGAYCLTFSNRFPYPLPNILLIKNDQIKQIFDPNIEKDFSLH
ncbi:MAG: diaminopimelate decarboxylase family protein [Promethearchaeota archaeon]